MRTSIICSLLLLSLSLCAPIDQGQLSAPHQLSTHSPLARPPSPSPPPSPENPSPRPSTPHPYPIPLVTAPSLGGLGPDQIVGFKMPGVSEPSYGVILTQPQHAKVFKITPVNEDPETLANRYHQPNVVHVSDNKVFHVHQDNLVDAKVKLRGLARQISIYQQEHQPSVNVITEAVRGSYNDRKDNEGSRGSRGGRRRRR